jgi:predicted flap endonuclease-1-like 5' DNA nuclease
MSLIFPNTKVAIDLFAGLVGLFFDRFDGTTAPEVAVVAKNDLTRIDGIGPTFGRRLNDAGINTFAELASSTPERVREVTRVAAWQGDPENWISQARALAEATDQ